MRAIVQHSTFNYGLVNQVRAGNRRSQLHWRWRAPVHLIRQRTKR
jgi:hypothetical protein